LKDTKSSNGTFVNKERLSRSGEESNPVEIKAGDELQFGVDVIENKKDTYICDLVLLSNTKYPWCWFYYICQFRGAASKSKVVRPNTLRGMVLR
jgi:hypothetical protein